MGSLTPERVAFYREHGYLSPIRVLPEDRATALRARLEVFEASRPEQRALLRNKAHLVFTWLDALIRESTILDAVEDLIGPDILCWSSGFFIKDAHDPSYVSWHQDRTYWGLEPPEIVTAWVALSESTEANGAMRVVPGTHQLDQVAHRDTFAADNLLSRGQEIAVEVDPAQAVPLPLRPGEMSLHHVRLIHGSEPNPSAARRIGFAIRYLPTHVRQVVGTRDSATLVRGTDRFGNFLPEQAPSSDLADAALAHHAQVTQQIGAVLMRGTPLAAM